MDNTLSEIVLVVDESGSMYCLRSAVVSSFNTFINEQKSGSGTAKLTLYTFADEVRTVLKDCHLQEVPPLSRSNYEPGGCTALLDAIGTAIDETGARLAALPEEKRPGTVIVGIMTDGYENASTHYTRQGVAERIRHQKEKYNWHFMFFGADKASVNAAVMMNIDRAEVAVWQAGDAEEVDTVMTSQSRRVRARRSACMGTATDEDKRVLCCSMADVADDVRRNKRKK